MPFIAILLAFILWTISFKPKPKPAPPPELTKGEKLVKAIKEFLK